MQQPVSNQAAGQGVSYALMEALRLCSEQTLTIMSVGTAVPASSFSSKKPYATACLKVPEMYVHPGQGAARLLS